MNQQIQNKEMWVRGLFMLLFIVVYSVSKFLIVGIMLLQFVTVMVTKKPNEQILKFSQGLGVYIYQIVQFLSFNTEQRPFPFSAWPTGILDSIEIQEADNRKTED